MRCCLKMMAETGSNVFVPANGANAVASPESNSRRSGGLVAFSNGNDLELVKDKLESLKHWTVQTYKTTKQSVYEHLGKMERTVDKELDTEIEALRDIHRRYQEVLAVSREFVSHFRQMTEMQKRLAEALYQLSLRETAIQPDCSTGCDSLRAIAHNGELLEKSLSYFLSSMCTLCEKTIVDTLNTVSQYDHARLQYDVYRHELLATQHAHPPATNATIVAAEGRCAEYAGKYEQLKRDVRVKLQLLDENRLKVMKKQLGLLQGALSAYFTSNASSLQANLDQLSSDGPVSTPSRPAPSFLEQ